ncbi:MAG: poly-beta-1,6 N-acetyl-D-glucosamine synthase [Gammaproteobacteria bacterium]|nr:poly-beta-1,6 N-acetyl-D-glucosamine synthase [Gammaproteobacteria bacterium]MBU1777378.1 poly-beta-1,6 N-acetyl-D-glucosamine synthase [Gammaproteobacteria bacterium]
MNELLATSVLPTTYSVKSFLFDFIFYYPFFMSYLWMSGAVFYYIRFERHYVNRTTPPELETHPGVALVIPCHNEEDNVIETVTQLFKQNYPDFEIIAINDGSTDRTQEILADLARQDKRLRVIHQVKNQGKASGLNLAALLTDKEFLFCIDGDCLLDENAVAWMMQHFISSPRVGAVTGNPRIRNRSSLLGKIQVGEFSSIIGLIKRSQRVYGRLFTVSGVIAAFRKSALHDIGYWSTEMLTDDIDVSWKMQLAHWDIRFEPKALCWILMPETLSGLWKQRLRWAMGGVQTWMKYFPTMFIWKKRRMWMVFLEFLTSLIWSYFIAAVIFLSLICMVLPVPEFLYVPPPYPGWNGVVLGFTCMLQISVSMYLDSKYDRGLWKIYFWMIWYPLIYWVLNVMTMVVAVPKTLMRNNKQHATWVSPDRGLKKL